ncbi:MAG TPA: CHASE domain-containing protein [Stellaceae bacterium]|nr:CHASE domain-containing protein [Stellaceae bacterium]
MTLLRLRHYWPALLAAVLGTAASIGAFQLARHAAQDRMAVELSARAESRARGLQEVLSRYEGTIDGFAASFQGSTIDWQQFTTYGRSMSLASRFLRSGFGSLTWAPRVTGAQRAEFETHAREDIPGYAIRDPGPDGVFVPAADRPEYFPIRFVDPMRRASPIGLDLLAEPTRAAAVRRAILQRRVVATPPFPFVTGGSGCLLFAAVFPTGEGNPSGGTEQPIGILAFRLLIGPAIGAILEALDPLPQGYDLFVFDDGAPAGDRLLYERRAGPGDAGGTPPSEDEVFTRPFFGSAFNFAGRDWTLILRPTPEYIARSLDYAGWGECATGLILTALLATYLMSSRHRADRLQVMAQGLQQEVSERRGAEQRLRLAQISMDRASEAISLIDAEGRFLNVNDAACRLLGYSRAELLQLKVFDIDPAMTRADWARRWEEARDGGAHSLDTFYRVKDGRLIPVDITANNLEFNGKEYHFTVVRDATARRQTERAIRVAKEQAEAASRAKSEFLANMSHELRTPLNAIIGFSDVMCNELFGPMSNPQYREYASDIRESGSHLLAVINDILDFSRAEAGELTLNESEVELPQVIRAARRLVEQRAAAARLTLETVLPPDPPLLLCDERLVKQMLINLLSNAVKFTPEGGSVRIAVEREPEGELLVRVSDTGIGLSAEEIAIALTPFRQVESGLNRKHPGTGLGLPLVKSLIELHGGNLKLESVPQHGTTAILTFPAARVIDTTIPPTAAAMSPAAAQ